ncbi:MAG: hypothetical protein AAFW84_21330 [Cyanobacteria bacterium J06635_15]
MESDKLPTFHGHDPLKLLAEEANPKMIHEWIDKLYETDFIENDPRLVFKIYTAAVLSEHTKTYPLNAEYQSKLIAICKLAVVVGNEALLTLQEL